MGFNEEFATWLQKELSLRNWTQGDLARAAGISRETVSKILSFKKSPGTIVLKAIATALKVPDSLIFTKAGLLNKPETTPLLNEIYNKLTLLSENEQSSILDYINFLLTKKR